LIKKREAAAITSALLAHLQVKEPATMTSNICVSKDLDITYFKLDFQVMMAATTLSSAIQASAIQHRTNSILCQKEKKKEVYVEGEKRRIHPYQVDLVFTMSFMVWNIPSISILNTLL
jgi:hypothetical protein